MPASDLLPNERHRAIRERLETRGRVLAVDLARELGASEDTIRRDLRELAALGACRRVYGGALPVSPASGPMSGRQAQLVERKAALAREAVKLVSPCQFVFLDAGSTNLAIARVLPQNVGLVVGVNAPAIATVLLERGGFEILLVGGRIDVQVGAAVGAQATREVQAMAPDICFLGACAIDPQATIRAFNFEDAAFKRSLVAGSKAVVIAATNERLGTTASFEVMSGGRLDHLVVEADAPPDFLNLIAPCGVKVHRVRD